jgi:hypothetical protein
LISLPNVANVIVEPPKLGYLFADPGKAKFFTMHGFDPSRPYELEAALRQHPVQNEIDDVLVTIHGTKFNVRCSMPSPNGRNPCIFIVLAVRFAHDICEVYHRLRESSVEP